MKNIALVLFQSTQRLFSFFGMNLNRTWPLVRNSDEYSETQLANCKVLPSRRHLLDELPKGGVAIELGVDSGKFSKEILDRVQPNRLILVDAWSTRRYGLDKKRGVIDRYDTEIQNGRIEVMQMLSSGAAGLFPDDYFDFVYIDTDHTYETTRLELDLYRQKVKPGGYICGDDYVVGNVSSSLHYGVIAAVSEFCQNENWPLSYLTLEPYRPSSFAIRRPL